MFVRKTALDCLFLISAAAMTGCGQRQTARQGDETDFLTSSQIHLSITTEQLTVSNNAVDLVTYQQRPMANPAGGDMFSGSNFFHPLKTPSGFVITELQPKDHLHHLGLWWPWKYVLVDGRKVLFWELQYGEGIVEAQGVTDYKTDKDSASFTAESHYVDRTAPNGPEVVLIESITVSVSDIVQSPASGYFLDIAITHCCVAEKLVEIVAYKYSGFTIRGTARWNRDNSALLTSEGIGWEGSNFSRADWIRVQGDADNGAKAGFVIMSCPQNRDTPQRLRTWGQEINKDPFINFNPVQERSWQFDPGREYTQKYRLFIYDGSMTAEQTRQLWSAYSDEFGTAFIQND